MISLKNENSEQNALFAFTKRQSFTHDGNEAHHHWRRILLISPHLLQYVENFARSLFIQFSVM